MKAQYNVSVYPHGNSAKTKGIASSVPIGAPEKTGYKYFYFELHEHEDPMEYLQKVFDPGDPRPLAGKSYVKPFRKFTTMKFRVGDGVVLNAPYIGFDGDYDSDGNPKQFKKGVVNEIIDEDRICVTLKGYSNPFVDFHRHEIKSVVRK